MLALQAATVTTQSSDRGQQLAKRLKDAGAKMYGAFWCSHCHEQKEAFGSQAMRDFPYVECYPNGFHKVVHSCFFVLALLRADETHTRHIMHGSIALPWLVCAGIAAGISACTSAWLSSILIMSAEQHEQDLYADLAGPLRSTGSPTPIVAMDLNSMQFDDLDKQCKDAKIQAFPAWIIKGQTYPGLQSFDKLDKLLDGQ